MTYETFDDAIEALGLLHHNVKKSGFYRGQPPMSREFFKLALAHLSESEQFLTLAHYHYIEDKGQNNG